jgi:hypothetical protein
MPEFRNSLATSDPRPITAEIVGEQCAAAVLPSNLFIATPAWLIVESRPDEELFWELLHGRLLDGSQTRQRRRFKTWAIDLIDAAGERSSEPILAIRFDATNGRLYVTRAILVRAHETYDGGSNVILTREVQKWWRELVGTIILDRVPTAGALRDELACLLFHAVVGTSRLPLTSIEAPLPGFAFGQIGYVRRPTNATGSLRSPGDLAELLKLKDLAESERVKTLELMLRATPHGEIPGLMARFRGWPADDILALLRAEFNSVTLSPYTDFARKALAFVRELAANGTVSSVERLEFICHLVRQLTRHLAAYDLITFHHRGANYPDALLLNDLLAELWPITAERSDLFAGDSRDARLRRRAVRHGLLLRLQYSGHPVPDMPTSPGENLRVLPAPFVQVPEDQIYSPMTRRRQLFTDELSPDPEFIRHCMSDLAQAEELQELGRALYLDRPFGYAKAPGEPDQTWLASHVLFSRSIAEQRLHVFAHRPEWLPVAMDVEQLRQRLRAIRVDGLPLLNAGPAARPGVVSLHDALRAADDWVFSRTTRQSLRDLARTFDFAPLDERFGSCPPGLADWRLVVPAGTHDEPAMRVYDSELRPRLELVADLSRGYGTRGGVEFPFAGLSMLRVGDDGDHVRDEIRLLPT